MSQERLNPSFPTAAALLLALALPLLIWQALPMAPPVLPQPIFVSLHSLLEVFAVALSLLVMLTAYVTRDRELASNGVWLSASFLAVALLDVMHTLSYKGMADFITPNSPHKAIVFWLGARYAAAGGLLAYGMLPSTNPAGRTSRVTAVAVGLVFAGVVAWLELAGTDLVPVFFQEGQGLTSTKISLERMVLALYLAASILIWRRKRLDPRGYLLVAALFMAVAELFFTLYSHVYDVGNLLGHAYKVCGYFWLYQAVFVEAVQLPMSRLAEAERARAESEGQLRQLFESAPDVILIIAPDGRIQYANARTRDILGYEPAELTGRPVEDLIPENLRARHASHRQDYGTQPMARPMGAGMRLCGRRKDGTEFPVEVGLSSVDMADGRRVLVFLRDVSERVRQEERMRYNATHDELTHLPNRTLLNSRLEQALGRSPLDEARGALILLDPDRFKQVNDTLGHEHGDWLLVSMVERLLSCLPEGAFLARFSGAEFAILLEGADAQGAAEIARRVQTRLAEPFQLGNQLLLQTVSQGIVLYPSHGSTPTTLLRHADLALNHAKDSGRDGFRFYTREMSEVINRRLALQAKLCQALEAAAPGGELRLEYQPKVSLKDGRITGWEALARWDSPTEGRVSPAEFIPVAEEYGLIAPLGAWVLKEACRQFAAWLDAGLEPGTLAVNLSARQLGDPDIPSTVAAILDETGLPPDRLELEITETAIMEEPQSAARTLGELRAVGVRLAVDDFGTGYSSLAYLKTFPLDKLKIDRSFVRDLGHDPNDAAIARTVVVLAHTLGLTVVAEGVETETQLAYLKWNHCDEIQGYLFSRSLPADACEALLQEGRKLAVEGLEEPFPAQPPKPFQANGEALA